MKKRVKVRKSGTVMVQKSCKRHLLVNKSKGQKKAFLNGYPVHPTKMRVLRKMMPGKGTRRVVRIMEDQAAEPVEKAA